MKTYTQDGVDELVVAASNRGFDVGHKTGRENGIQACAALLSADSASAFVNKRDEEARLLRALSDKLLTLLKP